jgi:aromatic-L-amino-acid decarboxylase
VSAFREALDEKLDLAQVVVDGLDADPNVEVCWRPQLSTVSFRLAGPSAGAADDELQAEFLRRINASKRVFLSSTRIHGRYVLRICIVSHRTHRDRIDECLEIVAKAAAELAA